MSIRVPQPGIAPQRSTLIELEHELIVSFRREAARREMPVTRLIHESLNTIVTDQLTTAILG